MFPVGSDQRTLPAKLDQRVCRLETRCDAQQRGFAAAVRAGQHIPAAGLEIEPHIGKQHALAKTFVELPQ